PGDQNELIARVAAANPNTVVALNAASPLAMPWLDQVAVLLQLWYPGQESGHALADILFGDVNPCGKLPTTFPKRLQDNPAYINYPGENGKVLYGEGIFVGYRYYDKKDIEPLFPFGHGLSYTTFEYSDLEIDNSPDGEITVSVKITNTGKRAGKEIVQLYLGDVESRLMRPEKELKRFAKVALQPGETREVAFTLDRQALAYYDPARKAWVAEAGTFEVLVGASSGDIRLRASFSCQGDAAPPGVRLHP
ncbi:MAG: glycosyl hydrolase, partial [Anaerolinea sp.]|nr:glycosyl hydrolase [Anaerolinea sp.]